MITNWYFQRGGQQYGPFTADGLKSLADTGQIYPTDLIGHEGMEQWVPARSFPGLLTVMAPPGGVSAPPYPFLPQQPAVEDDPLASLGIALATDPATQPTAGHGHPHPPHKSAAKSNQNTGLYIGLGLGVVVIGIVVVIYTMGGNPETPPPTSGAQAPVAANPIPTAGGANSAANIIGNSSYQSGLDQGYKETIALKQYQDPKHAVESFVKGDLHEAEVKHEEAAQLYGEESAEAQKCRGEVDGMKKGLAELGAPQ